MAAAVQNSGVQPSLAAPMPATNCLSKSIVETEAASKAEQQQDVVPEVDIIINNVVCTFNLKCHLNLRSIALKGENVEYRREKGMVSMKLRKPYTTASIWSSGKISCTGATSEEAAKKAARRFARSIQKLGFSVRFRNYRVVNVLATCSMPFGIKVAQFSAKHPKEAQYEPEIHPGVTYRIKEPKATLKIFSTGSITVTAPSISNVTTAVEHIYPLVHEFRNERSPEDLLEFEKSKNGKKRKRPVEEDEDRDDEVEGEIERLEDEDWSS